MRDQQSMDFDLQARMSLREALAQAERAAIKTGEINLDAALRLARTETQDPAIVAVWEDTIEAARAADLLFPHRKVAPLLTTWDPEEPQIIGHCLVNAAHDGRIHCVRRLLEMQTEHVSGSLLAGLFCAFAFLKTAEGGHVEVIRELLRPLPSASTAMMGYVVATRWKDYDDQSYPFIPTPSVVPGRNWSQKLHSTKSMLPSAVLALKKGSWDVQGISGQEEICQAIQATYRTYLLWRAGILAVSGGHVEVFEILLKQRALENALLADTFHHSGSNLKAYDNNGRKIMLERARMDNLMYQLVEELCTKQRRDNILHALWSHIQRGGRDSPRLQGGRPRCAALTQNGLWELNLEVPLLLMPIEHALVDEELLRRYKQLTKVSSQRVKVNIQLVASVEAQPTFLQVTVGIKHVRFKVENSQWDGQTMGHFPSLLTLSVTPVTKEGTGVSLTNSSSNVSYKVGVMERLQTMTGLVVGSTGPSGRLGMSAGLGISSTMKDKPWRFEQLPLKDDRGGSFVWTLQALKGVLFDRSNPTRMAEKQSKWQFGKRVPSNPIEQLPFTSEGGVIFTGVDFADTMIWRFPKHMDGTKLKWRIEGQVHCTFTSTRYWETRFASFCGDIEEKLKALEVKSKEKDGGEKEGKPGKAAKTSEATEKEGKEGKLGKVAKTSEATEKEGEGGRAGKVAKTSEATEEEGKEGKPGKVAKTSEAIEKEGKEGKPGKAAKASDVKEAEMESDYLEFLEFKRFKERRMLRLEGATSDVDSEVGEAMLGVEFLKGR